MSDNFKFVQMQPTTIGAAGQSIGDTSIILSSFLDIDGVALAMTDFGTKAFATIEPSSGSNEEQISFTGITQNGNGTATLTGVKSVLFKSPYTESSGLAKSHAGGVTFVISNTSGFYNEFTSKDDDETINGIYTFTQFPITPSSPPVSDYQVANKKYVDDTVTAGAANASTTVKGIVQLPTQAQADAKTATGSTGAALAMTPDVMRATKYNDYVADTGSASTYVIAPSPAIVAYATGQQFTFIAATANSANSGVSTLAVNGLAQKTIKKFLSTSLAVNDILVGQVVTVVYDGTNFQMINVVGNGTVDLATAQTVAGVKTFSSSPIAPTPSGATDVAIKSYVDGIVSATNGTTTKDTSDASTTQTIAHGLSRTPKKVFVKALIVSDAATKTAVYCEAFYNGSTQSSQTLWWSNTATLTADSSFKIGPNASGGANLYQEGVITFDQTNIYIAWTKSGTPTGTAQILWSAQ